MERFAVCMDYDNATIRVTKVVARTKREAIDKADEICGSNMKIYMLLTREEAEKAVKELKKSWISAK